MPVVAVDAMGGSLAPEEIVKGVAEMSVATDIECVLVGDERRIQAILDTMSYDPGQIAVEHAPEQVAMDEAPRDALKSKRRASIVVAAGLLARGRADALVSAGPVRVSVLACARELRVLPGVRKPALASVHPRQIGRPGQDRLALLLDIGATIRCDARELAEFAVMGSAWARVVSKVARPRVALLNMGPEPSKGGEVLVEAHRRIAQAPGMDFVGNVEGHDVAKGRADVIVCEGLVGNIVHKLIEDIAEVVTDLASTAATQRRVWRLGMNLLARDVRQLAHLTEYSTYGGAPLLGFEQPVVLLHPRAGGAAVGNAVKLAAKTVRDGVTQAIAVGVKGLR